MAEVEIPYKPRPLQMAMHDALEHHRFGVAVCHRRFGKTVLAVNQLIQRAVTCTKPRPRFAYIGPTYRQGKQTAWDYLRHYAEPVPGRQMNVSELRVDFPHNESQVRIFGADNPDSLRGLYLDGVVLDEYGLMPPNIWGEVLRPALADRQGWALFIGTPAGRNQFYTLIHGDNRDWPGAKAHPDWFFAEYKASFTGYIPREELEAARMDMTADEYAQEWECSFEAAVKGAIFAQELTKAREEGRITSIAIDTSLPVDTDWDLGVGDATAIWFSQSTRGGEVRLVDYYEASGEGFPHYAQVLQRRGYTYGRHWAPHDIQVRELGSGRSRLEVAAAHGIRFELTPRLSQAEAGEVEEGIHAARMLFSRCWFDETRCKAGLEALTNYRRDYNSRLDEFKATPVHDWACFTPDTKVLTRYGMRQIMDLPTNGEVLTPCGWKRYEGPKITRRSAQLVEVLFSDGHTVRCTPDHLFLTESGWKSAESLTPDSLIQSCLILSASTSMAASIVSGLRSAISLVVESASIAMFGWQRLAPFPIGAISITGTRTPPTIDWKTSNACLPQRISQRAAVGIAPSVASTSLLLRGTPLPIGTDLKLVAHGIADRPRALPRGLSGSVRRALASIAENWLTCWRAATAMLRSTALTPARPLRIVRVKRLSERADTWCIHVPDVECFALANGAIVHNSHAADAFRGLAVRHEIPRQKRRMGNVMMPREFQWS